MEYILLVLIAAQTTYLSVSQLTKNKRQSERSVFIDTSVLIDGRIKFLVETGFFPGVITIPRSVVGELQFLADQGDSEKRARARHGLDVVNELQSIEGADVVIFADSVKAEEGVDNRLLLLAKKHGGLLCTIDYNLNKVAQVEGIKVLNINDIAKSLRMDYLPGEKIFIEITQKGNDSTQGVGHLPDGTMVVVEGAKQSIGKIIEVEFIRSLQTSAGKMMFAKMSGSAKTSAKPSAKTSTKTNPKANAKTTIKKPANKTPKKKNYRRETPEDRLVELANNN